MGRFPILLLLLTLSTIVAYGFQQPIRRDRRKTVLTASSTLPKLEFTVEDFLTPSASNKATRIRNDDLTGKNFEDDIPHNLPADAPQEMDETESFLLLIENTPSGELQRTEIETIKDLLLDESMKKDEVVLERLLFRLLDEWSEVGIKKLKPSDEMFVRVMRAWQNRIGTDQSQYHTDILPKATDRILEIHHRYYNCFGGNTEIAEIALETLVYRRRVYRQVKSILKLYHTPSPKMIECHIVALARDGKPEVAERILRREQNLVISVETLNSILTGYAKANLEEVEIAENLVIYMVDGRKLQPNTSTFTCLIDCYSQQRSWKAAEKCESILNQMIALNDPNISPNIVAWTSVMSAWGKLTKEGKPDAVQRVNDLMKRVQQTFAAQDIDAHVYITWMRANTWSMTKEGLEKAEQILQEIEEMYLDGRDESFQPSAPSVRTLIDAWLESKLPRKVVEASRLAEQYESVLETSSEIYTSVWRALLLGWAEAGNPVHAETYLDRLIERGGETLIDSRCFDQIITTNTYINDANAIHRSVRIFDLYEQCRLTGQTKAHESVYRSFIRAMTKANVPQLLVKTQALVRRMHELYEGGIKNIEPMIYTYTAVLSACVAVTDDETVVVEQALALAVQTIQTIRLHHLDTITPMSICAMLQCANLIRNNDVKRTKWIETTFRLACTQGVVNGPVLCDFQRLAPAEVWSRILGDDAPTTNIIITDDQTVQLLLESSIPFEWKRNSQWVKESHRRR